MAYSLSSLCNSPQCLLVWSSKVEGLVGPVSGPFKIGWSHKPQTLASSPESYFGGESPLLNTEGGFLSYEAVVEASGMCGQRFLQKEAWWNRYLESSFVYSLGHSINI